MFNNPNIKMLMDLYKSGLDPKAMINILGMNNPQMQPVIQMLQQGNNPKEIFYNLCQQRGIDPNTIINQLK